jgi:hypothetical protein
LEGYGGDSAIHFGFRDTNQDEIVHMSEEEASLVRRQLHPHVTEAASSLTPDEVFSDFKFNRSDINELMPQIIFTHN